MPVEKFRSVEDMPDIVRDPADPATWRAIANTWAFAAKAFPRNFPKGVRRYRTPEEAEADREKWAAADRKRLLRSRQRSGKK